MRFPGLCRAPRRSSPPAPFVDCLGAMKGAGVRGWRVAVAATYPQRWRLPAARARRRSPRAKSPKGSALEYAQAAARRGDDRNPRPSCGGTGDRGSRVGSKGGRAQLHKTRSEEHTSELQSPDHLVCRLLLEKKKKNYRIKLRS